MIINRYWKAKGLKNGREERGWTYDDFIHNRLYVAETIWEKLKSSSEQVDCEPSLRSDR